MYKCIRVKKLAIALANKDNTIAKPWIYLRRIRPHFDSNVYQRHIYYFILIYYQVVYICEIWKSTSLFAYIDTIYGLHLKGQTQMLSQNLI
jgi:hypothetical protein